MITITQLNKYQLSLKCHYLYAARVKSIIPRATFDGQRREWIIDASYLSDLEDEFCGELVYKTPRWVILDEPMPDMSAIYQIHDKSIKAPPLKIPLYDYQDYGVRFMIDKIIQHGFVLNSDNCGVGKTAQAICTLKWFMENKYIRRVLVICKKSIKKQWADEFAKFTDIPDKIPVVYTGSTPRSRINAYDTISDMDEGILITNYHTFLNDTDKINSLRFQFVICDEAHEIKSRDGKMNNNIASVIQGLPTIFLTGTPIMSKPEDIFGVIQMVDKDYFGSWSRFKDRYIVTQYTPRFGLQVIGAKNLDELRNKVQDIVIRRTEYEVSIQMPEVIIQKRECDMDKTQEKLIALIKEKEDGYTAALQEIESRLKNPNVDVVALTKKKQMIESTSKALISAKQIACTEPRVFFLSSSKMMRDTYTPLIPKSYKMSSKTEAIIETIQDVLNSGYKVLLFTKFRTCAIQIAEDIRNVLHQDVAMYTGTSSDTERADAISFFRNGMCDILVGTEALATGVNLPEAKVVINIDQPDTLAIKTQRIGRARRVDSKFKNILVYDMITKSTPRTHSKDEERLMNIQNNQNVTDALISLDEAQRQALIEAMKG